MKPKSDIFQTISYHLEVWMAWILHKTIFHSSVGKVFFFFVDHGDTSPVPLDGYLLVYDQYWERTMRYGVRFDNRYTRFLPSSLLTLAVFTTASLELNVKPRFLELRGERLTPYGAIPDTEPFEGVMA